MDGQERVRSTSLDPETIAAFLDGRLNAEERARVINELARSPEDYETLIEAAANQRELAHASNSSSSPAKVTGEIPQAALVFTQRLKAPSWALGLPIAAAIVLLLALPTIFSRVRNPVTLNLLRGADWLDSARRAGPSAALGTNWSRVEWPASRSVEPSGSSTGAGFRAGVTLVNLIVAAQGRDSASVVATAADLTRVLGNVQGAGSAAAQSAQVQREPSAEHNQITRDVDRSMRELFGDSPWFALGVWVGQARLAALANDLSFFAPESRAARELSSIRDRLVVDVRASGDARSEAALNEVTSLSISIHARSLNDSAAVLQRLQSIVRLAGDVQL
jgi:hypothetical protein